MSPDGVAAAPVAAVHASFASGEDEPRSGGCRHCGLPTSPGAAFCCAGCAQAYDLVRGLGLGAYYQRRTIDPDQRPLRPDEDDAPPGLSAYVRDEGEGVAAATLLVEGLHCAACVWLIEQVLGRQDGVVSARVNMTSRRLELRWRSEATDVDRLAQVVGRLGYRLVGWDARCLRSAEASRERELLRAMAVAGFAFGNVMLFSVSVWAGHAQGMGDATRTLLHWLSALVALPAIVWAGRPFFRSAWAALSAGRSNMDVPISIGIALASSMSLYETARGGPHAYFDSAIGLLFFLLIGRYLDSRARGRARSSAEQLLALSARSVTVIDADGVARALPPAAVAVGMTALVAAGERISVDGCVVAGESSVDTSLIDGESAPKPAGVGDRVFAGALNLGAPLRIAVSAAGEGTLLAEITRLTEAAERRRSRYVILADRVARAYTPVVHTAALATFLGWLAAGVPWQNALMTAISVLIITCPCALALAVPVVQVLAVGRLTRRGVLVKSGDALERIARVSFLVFDKTGTLTLGRAALDDAASTPDGDLAAAAGLAAVSRHPLARALVRAAEGRGLGVRPSEGAIEVAGRGVERVEPAGTSRLGSAVFCGVDEGAAERGMTLWFVRPDEAPSRFVFKDALRSDAAPVAAALRERGLGLALLSGDQPAAVEAAARAAGIGDWAAAQKPDEKLARLEALRGRGERTLMVGDGLNDAPALAAAFASMSPSSAIDLTQTAADVVFQGDKLAPVVETIDVARSAGRLARQNLWLALAYNLVAAPVAAAGFVTPLAAAIAMSSSSIVVILNALRLDRARPWTSSST